MKGVCLSDPPSSGELYSIEVALGDVVIAGSDGLWDNLFPEEVARLVSGSDSAEEMCRLVAQAAGVRSKSEEYTPFQKEIERRYGAGHWTGGKKDDISVIAAIVN